MTPGEKAHALLTEVVNLAVSHEMDLPNRRYVCFGQPVVDCEAVFVAVTAIDPHEQYGPLECNASQLGTFSVVIARSCGWTADQNGVTDLTALAAVSIVQNSDGQLLWTFANELDSYLSKTWSLGWSMDGGLAASTLLLTTGIE